MGVCFPCTPHGRFHAVVSSGPGPKPTSRRVDALASMCGRGGLEKCGVVPSGALLVRHAQTVPRLAVDRRAGRRNISATCLSGAAGEQARLGMCCAVAARVGRGGGTKG
jgi:hypothetical protein